MDDEGVHISGIKFAYVGIIFNLDQLYRILPEETAKSCISRVLDKMIASDPVLFFHNVKCPADGTRRLFIIVLYHKVENSC